MQKTNMVITRNVELEEEIKIVRDGYEEEIAVLLEQNEALKKKVGTGTVKPEPEIGITMENYILIDDTDSDESDYEDEAKADIMESSDDSD